MIRRAANPWREPAGATTRREFLASLAAAAIAGTSSCNSRSATPELNTQPARLTARVSAPTQRIEPGRHDLGLAAGRDGVLYIPRSYRSDTPAALVMLLHGAGGRAGNWFGSYGNRAEELGLIILAPESRGATWDAIRGDFGRDVPFVDAALEYTFDCVAIDPRRVAIAGFSDGASYAISLGLPNGDLFTHVIAYSPGFVRGHTANGKPPLFVSHGVSDQILPIATTSRLIVPSLRARGYAVDFVEFAGGHEVPPAITKQALDWFLKA
ncbi:MAG: alpha/beta hydrolase [Gemmatimonadaceae bacterium]